MKRKGRMRWRNEKGFWSAWYDLSLPIPEELNSIEVTAVEVQEEMSKAEYEATYGANHDAQARARTEIE